MTGENELDGVWDVHRTGGALPPMRGVVRKRIENGRGRTIALGVRVRSSSRD
jgi:predicted phosphatase